MRNTVVFMSIHHRSFPLHLHWLFFFSDKAFFGQTRESHTVYIDPSCTFHPTACSQIHCDRNFYVTQKKTLKGMPNSRYKLCSNRNGEMTTKYFPYIVHSCDFLSAKLRSPV